MALQLFNLVEPPLTDSRGMTLVCSVNLAHLLDNFYTVPSSINSQSPLIATSYPHKHELTNHFLASLLYILIPQAPFFIWWQTATGGGERLQQAQASLELVHKGLHGHTIVHQGPQQPSARQHQIQHEAHPSKWTPTEVGTPEEG